MDACTYRRSPQALSADVGDDVIALHVANGKCYGMEAVSSVVWALLEQPVTLDQICAALIERYDVSPEKCQAEVRALLNQFECEGLVESV